MTCTSALFKTCKSTHKHMIIYTLLLNNCLLRRTSRFACAKIPQQGLLTHHCDLREKGDERICVELGVELITFSCSNQVRVLYYLHNMFFMSHLFFRLEPFESLSEKPIKAGTYHRVFASHLDSNNGDQLLHTQFLARHHTFCSSASSPPQGRGHDFSFI